MTASASISMIMSGWINALTSTIVAGRANVGKGRVMCLAHSRVLSNVSDEDACADNIAE